MKVYTYWVNKDSAGMPEYINLCMYTWHLAVPHMELEVINHNNIKEYVPEELLTPSFYQLSLAMQSDIVSVMVLLSRGGIFIDADTIMTGNPFKHSVFQQNKFIAFGYPAKKSIHLAILCSPQPNNPILISWAKEISSRLASALPDPVPWDYVGNGVVNDLLQKDENQKYVSIIDAQDSGNILELLNDQSTPYLRYMHFYFSSPKISIDKIIEMARFNLISLHNSWTPDAYRKASLEQIMKSRQSIFLSGLLLELIENMTPGRS